jgi:hypothetical protein
MKQKLVSTLILIFFLISFDFVYTWFALNGYEFTYRWRYEFIHLIIITFLFFFILANLTYKSLFSFNSSKIKILFSLISLLLFSFFLAKRVVSISKYYLFAINEPKRPSNELWQPDLYLAHKGIPFKKGQYEYFIDSINGQIDVQFDSLGFRCVSEANKIKSDTLNLFLGCSWTFGDFIIAEEGYPHKVSKLLNQNYINAGASAYGFAQMKQILDSLIIKHSFKYVFIQLSPWLSKRAMSFNGPSYFGYSPFPYFSEKNNSFQLEKTPYRAIKKRREWRSKKSYINKLKFYVTNGFEEEIINYSRYQMALLKSNLGLLKKPTNKKNELELFFYQHAISICNQHNAIPVIIKFGYQKLGFNIDRLPDNEELIIYLKKNNIKVIDLDYALMIDTTDFNNPKRFEIFHKLQDGKKLYYDNHPNPWANTIFSNTIFNSLNK